MQPQRKRKILLTEIFAQYMQKIFLKFNFVLLARHVRVASLCIGLNWEMKWTFFLYLLFVKGDTTTLEWGKKTVKVSAAWKLMMMILLPSKHIEEKRKMGKDTDVVYIRIRMETRMMASGENQENMAGVFTHMTTVKGAHFQNSMLYYSTIYCFYTSCLLLMNIYLRIFLPYF